MKTKEYLSYVWRADWHVSC